MDSSWWNTFHYCVSGKGGITSGNSVLMLLVLPPPLYGVLGQCSITTAGFSQHKWIMLATHRLYTCGDSVQLVKFNCAVSSGSVPSQIKYIRKNIIEEPQQKELYCCDRTGGSFSSCKLKWPTLRLLRFHFSTFCFITNHFVTPS